MSKAYCHRDKQGKGGFGTRLKQTRLEQGISVLRFAEEVGIAQCLVTGYENRGVDPCLKNAAAMAQVLGVSLDWLATGEGEKRPGRFRQAGIWEPSGEKFVTYRQERLDGVAMYVKEAA